MGHKLRSDMPIRFRCEKCHRLLGIARRKAGTQTRCPHCACVIIVPALQPESLTEPMGVSAKHVAITQTGTNAGPSQCQPTQTSDRALDQVKCQSVTLDDSPLFERKIEELLQELQIPAFKPSQKPHQQTEPLANLNIQNLHSEIDILAFSYQQIILIIVFFMFLILAAFITGFIVGQSA